VQSNTTVSHRCIYDYIEQLHVLAFTGHLERTNLKSYYMHCARTWCRDLYITGFIMYKFKVKLMLVYDKPHNAEISTPRAHAMHIVGF